MLSYVPRQIYLERGAEESPITKNVLRALPRVPVEIVESAEELLAEARRFSPSLQSAKRSLILARFRGNFFKPCPGQQSRGDTSNVCCDYFVINFASNCHMECTYCYLQDYLNFPYMIVYTNLEDLLGELRDFLDSRRDRVYRIGTGELADSLALDPLTGYSVPLVEFFSRYSNALLELKTKSDCVEKLLPLKHNGRTVVAWSMNPDFIQRSEEHKTASIPERLEAARRCADAGYPVAFHLDPLIHYPGWEKGYRQLVSEFFRHLRPEEVAWISLGGLRMAPAQRDFIKERFPRSLVPHGELVPARDGKLRYFKPLRLSLYSRLLEWIERYGPGTRVYACMERPEIWTQTFGAIPSSGAALNQKLVELST